MGYLLDIGKETYLQEHGYTWAPEYDAYIHRDQWKIFTRSYLDDHAFETILARLGEAAVPGQWQIYTSTESEVDIHNIHKHYGAMI